MLLAGEDTTAYTLAWAVHHLCDSPAAVAALRAELDAALRARPSRGARRHRERPTGSPTRAPSPTRRCGCGRWRRCSSSRAIVDTVIGDVRVPGGHAGGRAARVRRCAIRAHFADAGGLPPRALAGRAGTRARTSRGAHAVRQRAAHLPGAHAGAAGDEGGAGAALRHFDVERDGRAEACASASRSRCRPKACACGCGREEDREPCMAPWGSGGEPRSGGKPPVRRADPSRAHPYSHALTTT